MPGACLVSLAPGIWKECQVESSTTVLESQVDWLTCGVHTDAKQVELEHLAIGWAKPEMADGHRMVPFRLLGFEGWRAGRVRYGTRTTGGLLQLSGDLAAQHLGQLVGLADSISRVDLAVTCRTPVLQDGVAQRHYQEALAHLAAHPRAAMPWLVQNARNGETCYVGDRSSDWFLRVYNKQRQQEQVGDAKGQLHYAGCWRYELEVKGCPAELVANRLAESADTATDVQCAVHAHCRGHGFSPLFEHTGGTQLVGGFRRQSDYDTRLRWLTRSVAPAVKWMLEQDGRADVLRALDLGESSAT